jgi:cell division protein FtsZ
VDSRSFLKEKSKESVMIEFGQANTIMPVGATIKVLGVGGAGGNTVDSIIDSGYKGVEYVAVNTDAQALERSKADVKVQIGMKSSKGLGAGADPEIGRRAAEEDLDKVIQTLEGSDIVFLTAGMGGGTGSGALPVIVHALRERNILTIAIVTKPFLFEGKRRSRCAQEAINELSKEVDTLIVIPNQKLLDVVEQNISMIDAFTMINDVLGQSVRSITDIITKYGYINVDFSDVRTIMKDRGLAVMGTGKASGQSRAHKAATQAISSPLLENMSIAGAHAVLLNVTGGKTLGLHEISEAAQVVYEQAHEEANIILGSVIDESMDQEVVVTIIATGFEPGTRVQDPKQEIGVREPAVAKSFTGSPVVRETPRSEPSSRLNNDFLLEGDPLAPDDLDIPAFLRKKSDQSEII